MFHSRTKFISELDFIIYAMTSRCNEPRKYSIVFLTLGCKTNMLNKVERELNSNYIERENSCNAILILKVFMSLISALVPLDGT